MRRLLLVSVTVSLAAVSALLVSLFAFSENSLASDSPSQGTFTQGATAGPNEPSLVDGTGPSDSVRDDAVVTTNGRPSQEYCEGGAVAHRHPLRELAAGELQGLPIRRLLLHHEARLQEIRQEAARQPGPPVADEADGREVQSSPRRPGLLQGGRKEQAHNPRGDILGQWQSCPRLQLFRQGSGEQDEVYARLLWREEDTMEIDATR